MNTPITEATISSPLKNDGSIYWNDVTLPSNSSKVTDAFKLGQTMGGCEVRVDCNIGTTLASDLVIELTTCATETGTYATQASKTIPAGAIVAGDFLAGLILPRELNDELYTKIKLTTSAVQATGTVDAYLVFVS